MAVAVDWFERSCSPVINSDAHLDQLIRVGTCRAGIRVPSANIENLSLGNNIHELGAIGLGISS